MGKVTIKIPLVTWRDGRPRFVAGVRHRRLGLKGEDLRHPDGTWFSLDQAIAWSEERAALIARLAGARPAQRKLIVAGRGRLTVGQLLEAWFSEPRFNGEAVIEGKKHRPPLAKATVRYYRNAANQLEALDDGRVWVASAEAVTVRTFEGVLDNIEIKHGLATARALRATLTGAYLWGRRAGKLAHNPIGGAGAKLPTLPPRVRYGSIAEMRALVAAADAIGRPEIGDSIMLGLWTGQRQADRLALSDAQITGNGILFRQGKKRGQPLLIPAAPELAVRLKDAARRRKPWHVNYPQVVLDEFARRPFAADWYRKQFQAVRKAAVAGVPGAGGGWLVQPCKSLDDFHDQDLRDTAVTWLALAGVDKIGISSVTGHSLKSIDTVLKHYLGLHPELARSAIASLVDWYDEESKK